MTSPARILVVDDEPAIRAFLRVSLTGHGYAVLEAGTAADALAQAAAQHLDLVVLDVGLPDLPGPIVVRQLREWSGVPILMLSVRNAERDKIEALDAGADDYLTKPFSLGELLARIRAALRRSARGPQGEARFEWEDLQVDLSARRVLQGGQEVQLTPREFELLRVFVTHAGRVLTHRQLLQAAWGPEYAQDTHLLRVTVSNLRRKLEPDPVRPRYVVTEAGVGYRLRAG